MKKGLLVVGILVAWVAGSDVLACGDKFLVVSRGTRFERAAIARQPANILVYANPSSTLPKALERVPVEATLRKAGYQPLSVGGPTELEQALRKGGWDLVLADLSDSSILRARLQDDGAPMILPVAYAATGSDIASARQTFPRVLKGPVKGQALIDAIDEALALRQRLRSKTA